jgi:hypothetical protein
MTTITSLGRLAAVTPQPAVSQAGASSLGKNTLQGDVASPSTSVTLGQPAAVDTQVYSVAQVLASAAAGPLWENKATDAITSLMARNYSSQPLAGQFHGLGAALLDRLKIDGGDYSQSVLVGAPANASATGVDTLMQSQLHGQADNQISLDIKTASGATVHLSLGSQGNGLAVEMQVTGGTLTSADRAAISKLSGAFQDAIDGLTAQPPHLDLGGLTQFDSNVLKSVDFHSSLKLDGVNPQTVDFHADSKQRTLSSTGLTGTVKVAVDMSNPAIFGNAKQQAQAIQTYLKQFDNANSRGHGDASLMGMFKDAFTELNSNIGAATQSRAPSAIALSDTDHSALTGLADFTASVSQAAVQSNPMRPSERDTFSYRVSQNTSVTGHSQDDRSITQEQQSHLSASYHMPLPGADALKLTDSNQSQNYLFYQIQDDASSKTELGYDKGKLVNATSTQSASQTTHVQKYLMGALADDTTTPSQASRTQDLLGLLKSAQSKTGPMSLTDSYRQQQALFSISNRIALNGDPSQLR